jgi:hypothetical protein
MVDGQGKLNSVSVYTETERGRPVKARRIEESAAQSQGVVGTGLQKSGSRSAGDGAPWRLVEHESKRWYTLFTEKVIRFRLFTRIKSVLQAALEQCSEGTEIPVKAGDNDAWLGLFWCFAGHQKTVRYYTRSISDAGSSSTALFNSFETNLKRSA